jgi:hypothetical protein
MSAGLLAELERLGVRVERFGGRLLLDGPEDVLTDALVAEIAAAKPGLLASLEGRGRTDRSAARWRCYACRGLKRTYRPAWGDTTCARCGAIVAGPDQTERPWRLKRRHGPVELGTAPRVAWGRVRGYVAVHDPATGEWHELAYRDAPSAWQAAVRKRPSRAGGG